MTEPIERHSTDQQLEEKFGKRLDGLAESVDELVNAYALNSRLDGAKQELAKDAVKQLTEANKRGLTLQIIERRRKIGNLVGVLVVVVAVVFGAWGYNITSRLGRVNQSNLDFQLDAAESSFKACQGNVLSSTVAAAVFTALANNQNNLAMIEASNHTPGIESIRAQRITTYNNLYNLISPLATQATLAAKTTAGRCHIYSDRQVSLRKQGAHDK